MAVRHGLACALFLSAGAVAAQTLDANTQVRAAAQAFEQAQVEGDRAALERLLAPDFLLVRASGRIGDKADFIAGFTDPKSKLQPYQIVDRLFVRPSDDSAIVGGEATVRGTENGKAFSQHFRYSDMFAKRNDQWVVVYTQITPLP
ncbi:nuclear transport factor 2 family protein [Sphingomonas sp. ASY06-1R]|uniref:nuclear transport factor 2 family protein n=1 Tax=Sphingomonas sp. ASY06-1R TaxID=3445771 RepID=UPI003FA20763